MGNVRRVPISIEPPADAEAPQRNPKAPAPGERTTSHYEGCRGCGDVPGSLRVRSWVGDDGVSVVSRFDVLEEHQGAPGLLHGGMLMTAFDDALGTAYTQVTRSAVTARLETDFRRPVPVGTTVWLRSRVDARVGRKIYVSGEARLGALDGEVVGTARALFLKVGVEHFLRHGRPEDLEALGASREVIEAARAAP
ncbi:PaaI family thioesterase [Actinomycetospora lemnae]|uniref:Acyl-coenzyme A thioesterase THEM4 n=1 Tax=Actinomycetospora lemnae TaxID=3019891 RepID=A0ABT5ST14_9PSEU|nr:PaaI family thioesterase [Actinomycetospora sp. DW7H6]MDD7965982.1 PaaI family thioesterase [Actinomycetospora sp. DW7H6]